MTSVCVDWYNSSQLGVLKQLSSVRYTFLQNGKVHFSDNFWMFSLMGVTISKPFMFNMWRRSKHKFEFRCKLPCYCYVEFRKLVLSVKISRVRCATHNQLMADLPPALASVTFSPQRCEHRSCIIVTGKLWQLLVSRTYNPIDSVANATYEFQFLKLM